MAIRVSRDRFAELVEEALAELPEAFAEVLEEVPVQIEMRPSRRLLSDLGIENDGGLLGLYQGASLINEVDAEGRGSPQPRHILIFQQSHELQCDTEEELVREVRKTVLHELGHFFGMNEDDLEELGYG